MHTATNKRVRVTIHLLQLFISFLCNIALPGEPLSGEHCQGKEGLDGMSCKLSGKSGAGWMKIEDDEDDVDAYDTMAGNWAVSSIGQREE